MFRTALRAATMQGRFFSATPVAMMPVQFTKTHEWVNIEGTKATMGITQYAQEELGEVVYIDLPEVGEQVIEGEQYGTVESVKATSQLMSPVSGTITEVNEELTNNTALVNESPEVKAWTIKVDEVQEPKEKLLSREEYDHYLESECGDN